MEISIFVHRIIRLIKHILYFCLFYTRLVYFLQMVMLAPSGGGIRILCFHRVINDEDTSGSSHITRSEFERLIKYLTRYYKIISLEKCIQLLGSGGHLPRRYMVITFDDGYADNYFNAYPILIRYRVPATFFLTTGVIGTVDSPWFQRVYNMFSRTSLESVTIDWLVETLTWGQDMRARMKAMTKVTESLKTVPPEERDRRIDALHELLGNITDKPHKTDRMLSWKEVTEMVKDPLVSIGAHTVTHPILSTISEESEAWDEIYNSAYMIKQKIGQWPKSFCYPNGGEKDFNELHKKLVREAGFICACSLIRGFNNHGTDIYELKRLCVSHDVLYITALNIAGADDLIAFVRNRIGSVIANSTRKIYALCELL